MCSGGPSSQCFYECTAAPKKINLLSLGNVTEMIVLADPVSTVSPYRLTSCGVGLLGSWFHVVVARMAAARARRVVEPVGHVDRDQRVRSRRCS